MPRTNPRACLHRCFLFLLLTSLAAAQTAEQRTAHYLDSIRKQPGFSAGIFYANCPRAAIFTITWTAQSMRRTFVDFAADGGLLR